MRLYNDKVRIIPAEDSHWPRIYSWQHSGDYDSFFGNMPMLDSRTSGQFLRDNLCFMILDPKDVNKIMGMFVINRIEERHRNAHFGVLIDKAFQGQKIARPSIIMMIDYILNMMNFYKVIARVNEGNDVSAYLTETIGFKKEAELEDEIYYNGEFKNVIRYYITKGKFNKLYKKKSEKVKNTENLSNVA